MSHPNFQNMEQPDELCRRQRRRGVVTLAERTVNAHQELYLRQRFDAFRADMHREGVAQGTTPSSTGALPLGRGPECDERLLGLESVHGQPLEVAQRRVARVEVIQRQKDAAKRMVRALKGAA